MPCLPDKILQGIRDDEEYADVRTSLLTFPILTLKGTNSFIGAADLYRKCNVPESVPRGESLLIGRGLEIDDDIVFLESFRRRLVVK